MTTETTLLLRYFRLHNYWVIKENYTAELSELQELGIPVKFNQDRFRLECLCTFTETSKAIHPECWAHGEGRRV